MWTKNRLSNGVAARTLAVVAIVVPLGLGLTACGGGEDAAGEEVAEKILEEAAEQSGNEGADVDVDLGSGEMTVEGENGSMSFGSTELPEEFPDDLPLPKSEYTVRYSSVADGRIAVQVSVPGGDFDAIAAHIEQGLVDADYAVEEPNKTTMGSVRSTIYAGTRDGEEVTITVQSFGEKSEPAVNLIYSIGSQGA